MFYNLRLIYSSLFRKGILNMDCSHLKLENKAKEAENIISFLKTEIKELKLLASKDQIIRKLKSVNEENEALKKQIDFVKNELINLQMLNGKKQVPLPESRGTTVKCDAEKTDVNKQEVKSEQPVNKIKEKEDKVLKPKKEVPEEPPVDVGRLDFRVGYILEAKKHPDADTLYVEQIDLGEETPRTIVSGLVNHVPLEEFQNRSVVVLCNLKPMKMRGILSQGMVMCASTPEAIEPLNPPEGSVPGDLITVNGYTRNPDPILIPKKKIFETVAPDLKTNSEGLATYKGVEWRVGDKGIVKANLVEAAIK